MKASTLKLAAAVVAMTAIGGLASVAFAATKTCPVDDEPSNNWTTITEKQSACQSNDSKDPVATEVQNPGGQTPAPKQP